MPVARAARLGGIPSRHQTVWQQVVSKMFVPDYQPSRASNLAPSYLHGRKPGPNWPGFHGVNARVRHPMTPGGSRRERASASQAEDVRGVRLSVLHGMRTTNTAFVLRRGIALLARYAWRYEPRCSHHPIITYLLGSFAERKGLGQRIQSSLFS